MFVRDLDFIEILLFFDLVFVTFTFKKSELSYSNGIDKKEILISLIFYVMISAREEVNL